MIRVFEAFAGIGGFRSGLERVGGFWTIVNNLDTKRRKEKRLK